MRHLPLYDMMEGLRATNEWLGATTRAFWSSPAFGLVPHPLPRMMAAWGALAERSFARMNARPDWGIESVVSDHAEHGVEIVPEITRPFGDLVRFRVRRPLEARRKVLLVAPMSGHYPTLLRGTVASLLPDAEVWVTEWKNARDVPVSEGRFDVEDYTRYLIDFIRHLGPEVNVIAVCQPAPLALAAVARLAATEPAVAPRTLTLIGGPIDPGAAPTEVTEFGDRVPITELERLAIQRVGVQHPGVGRKVYPGLMQLASFMSMNAERHARAFMEELMRLARGEAGEHDAHNRFYDEYLAVMDMPAEFYLSTVERIFQKREIARGRFTLGGEPVDLAAIRDTAVLVVEGEEDDISAPGQCIAALDLLPGLPEGKKAAHLEPAAGHYGIFAGRRWRENIRPLVLDLIDTHARGKTPQPAR